MNGNFYKSPLIKEFMKKSIEEDFDFLSIDNRGKEIISRFYGKKKLVLGTALEKFEDCAYDIDAAVSFVLKKGYKHIILAGYSTGCQKIVYYINMRKNKHVQALVFIAPVDDYAVSHRRLGKKYSKALRLAQSMVHYKQGNKLMPSWASFHSAQRFLSYASPKSIESQIFNYKGKLSMLSKIHQPVLVIFGEKDEHIVGTVYEYKAVIESKISSLLFIFKTIKNADHSFLGKEAMVIKLVSQWFKRVSETTAAFEAP